MPAATPDSLARALRARASERSAALASVERMILDRLPEIARLLRERHGASRVVLFGSLAWGGFHARSDVDLAVEGVPRSALGVATADAEAIARRTVELFPLDDLPPAFRARVLAEGKDLA